MRFSVIIPLYNKAPYVSKALESVLTQTFKDFEIIVIDDGSTDNSYDKAKAVLARTPVKYRLVHQENAGVSAARNSGVALSSGRYLCFLDADDWWTPTFLERMNWLIDTYPEAGIYGTNYYYVKNGRKRVCVKGAETGYINYCKVYAEGMGMPLWTGAVSVPKWAFVETGGFRSHLKLGEDFDLWIKIVLKYKVAFLNEPLSFYYQDSDINWRLIGKLHAPASHMLWNLDYLSDEEKTNPDFKRLIDNLRVYSLMPYYLSKQFREKAKEELAKVDWEGQPAKTRFLYRMPVFFLKGRNCFRKLGSLIKQVIIRYL